MARSLKNTKIVSAFALVLSLAACSGETSDVQQDQEGYAKEAKLNADIWPAIPSPVAKDPAIETKIEAILAQMTVEEKVGQIIQSEIQYTTPEDVKKYHLGSVLNGGGSFPNKNKQAKPAEWLEMADAFYDASMDASDGNVAIPIIWGSDAVHGHSNVLGATLFPHNIGLGAMRNPALMRDIGRVTAREMRVTGIDWTFAPTVAVVQNDRWGRTYESYSEDPSIVRSYAGEVVYGLQGVPGTPEFLDVNHVVSTAKHFVGDGGTTDGDDQGNTEVSEEELRDIHAQGYVTALEAGVQSAMASFNSWNGNKLHGSKYLLTDVLKNRMGLDGFVVGDWNGHGQIPGCTNSSCAASINAGVDLIMVPQDWKEFYYSTLEQVNSGEITMERLDDAVTRVLRVKFRAGLFDKGRPSDRGIAGMDGIIGSAEHRAVARQAVRESLVLLKNEGSILPLNPTQTVLIAGDGADNMGKQTGGWTITWQGTGNVKSDFPGGTSIYDGIKDAVEAGGGEVLYSVDGSYSKKPDVAVVVFGEDPYAEFQGDRDTLEFEAGNKKAIKLLEKLKSENIPVVSVFLSGRPMWVNPEINASDAFVAAWLPGSEGVGVADVLVADAGGAAQNDFMGTLPFSWPKLPLQDILNPHHDNYDPLFAFGYGLTYASASEGIGDLAVDVEGVDKGNEDMLTIFAGRPPAPWQVYAADTQGNVFMSGAYISTPTSSASIKTADMNVQEDALEVTFAGTDKAGMAILAFETKEPFNYSNLLAKGGAISFAVKLDDAPEKDVFVKLQCGETCERRVNITDHLKSLIGHDWQTMSVSLSCFSEQEGDLSELTSPFGLESDGKAVISFADVYVKANTSSSVSCE